MAKNPTHARLLVKYGKHREGETIRGDLADKLIADKMAVDVTPKVRPKKATGKKDAGAAPENKAEGGGNEFKA